MKTKIMMLLAAMLLSASALAQSGNNEPLKGDVNGDGKVDVADINAVIKIMKDGGGTGEETLFYSYVGTDKSEKLVYAVDGKLKPDIATQIQSISGVKTYTSMPTSLHEEIF